MAPAGRPRGSRSPPPPRRPPGRAGGAGRPRSAVCRTRGARHRSRNGCGAGRSWPRRRRTPAARARRGRPRTGSAIGPNMMVSNIGAFHSFPPPMPPAPPPTIAPVAPSRWHAAAPAHSPWLHEEVARRMESRLQWIREAPAAWCHWDAVRGGLQGHALVRQRYPDAVCYVVETSAPMRPHAASALTAPWWNAARWKGGRVHFEQPAPAGVQMLWANMALHMAPDPQALIAQWNQALAVDGYLMFSCLGPDSLREVRAVYAALGWPAPGHAFTDMHDWGDMLIEAGFAEPVMDMERITLTFPTAERLLQGRSA